MPKVEKFIVSISDFILRQLSVSIFDNTKNCKSVQVQVNSLNYLLTIMHFQSNVSIQLGLCKHTAIVLWFVWIIVTTILVDVSYSYLYMVAFVRIKHRTNQMSNTCNILTRWNIHWGRFAALKKSQFKYRQHLFARQSYAHNTSITRASFFMKK